LAAGRAGHAVRPGDRRLHAGLHHAGRAGPAARFPPLRHRSVAGRAGAGSAWRRAGLREELAAAPPCCGNGTGRMSAAPILRVDARSKRLRGLLAISDVSFAVEPGSITSVIGPNGAGKSTLFNLVTGYLAPTAGTVSFKERTITGLATNRIAELGVSRAFQIARPFRDLSVAENVHIGALFGKAGARDVAATTREALALAGMTHLAEEPASVLTVGQLRHLEVARAIAPRADLLLAAAPCARLN